MPDKLFANRRNKLQRQLDHSHKLLRQPPSACQAELTDAFAQIDITLEEFRLAEEELRRQNNALIEAGSRLELERERYRNLFDFAPNGYIATDFGGTILEANQAACVLLNVNHRILIGKLLTAFIDRSDRPTLRKDLMELERWKHIPEREVTIHPRKGDPFLARLAVSAQYNNFAGIEIYFCINNISKYLETACLGK